MKTIEVIPNPYAAIDADGVPQGVVGLPGTRGAWIGAALDEVASKATGKCRFYFPPANERRKEKSVGGMRVVTLHVSDANVRATVANAILEGSLIVVSKDGATKVGIVNEYLEAEEALEAEKTRAKAALRALRGDDAELKAIPHEPTKSDEDNAEEAPTPATAVPASSGERVTKVLTLHTSTEA